VFQAQDGSKGDLTQFSFPSKLFCCLIARYFDLVFPETYIIDEAMRMMNEAETSLCLSHRKNPLKQISIPIDSNSDTVSDEVNIGKEEVKETEGLQYEREFIVQTQTITMSLGVWKQIGLGDCIPVIRKQCEWFSQLCYWASILANCVAIEKDDIEPDQPFYSQILQTIVTSKTNSHFTTIMKKYGIAKMKPLDKFSWSYFREPVARQMKANATVHLSEETIKARLHKTLMLYDEINGQTASKMVKCLYEGKEYNPPKKKTNNKNDSNQIANEARQKEIFELYKAHFDQVDLTPFFWNK